MGWSKQDKAYFDALMAAISQRKQPSEIETAGLQDWKELRNFLRGGATGTRDYRNLPGGAPVDLLPIADYKRFASYGQAGDTAANGAGSNAMAIHHMNQLSNDKLTRDWGQQYENTIGGLRGYNNQLGGMLQDAYTDRMAGGVQGAGMLLDAYRNRPKSQFNWGGLLGAGLGAGLKFI